MSQYCNGSRSPPELASAGWQVPPGIADATVPNPPFTLAPAATVDEGNNWVNMSWGPLAETNPVNGDARQLRACGRLTGHQLHPVNGSNLRNGTEHGFLRQSEKDQQCGRRRRG